VRADAARVARTDRLLQSGLRGERLRDSESPLLVLLVELPVQVPLHDGKASRHRHYQDRDHHDDNLGGQALHASSHNVLASGPCRRRGIAAGVSEV
jgi:hypothetical protein